MPNIQRIPVHDAFRALDYHNEWTGGNCQAWKKQVGNLVAYISAEDATLGDTFDEEYGVSIEDHNDSLYTMTGSFAEVTEYAELHLKSR
jgi:hypothetical protein